MYQKNCKLQLISLTKILSITGRLEHLDLAGNTFCNQLTDADSVLAELRVDAHFALNAVLSAAPNVPYDNDP